MKSFGGIWERIVSEDNLRAAWKRVRRGHGHSPEVLAYGGALEANLAVLRDALASGSWRPGAFRQFKIWDPKPRVISCAPVKDRVVHHAFCGVVAPLLERSFIDRSFACREGKGSHRACRLAREQAKRHGWFLKMDVRRYFDSIPHGRLLEILQPKFRERRVRELLAAIVRQPVPGLPDGYGLPIGNLTSQWFANAYLDGLDHWLAEGGGQPSPAAAARGDACLSGGFALGVAYLRYMDDMLVFADSKAVCWAVHDAARKWLARERGLDLKDEATIVAPVTEGLPFLGLRIFPGAWRLRRSRFLRTRRKAAGRVAAFEAGRIEGARLAQSLASADGSARWFGFKGILNNVAAGEGASSGSNRGKRGGSWNNNAANCRSANRNNNNPSNTNNNLGFRLSSIQPGHPTRPPTGSHPAPPAPRDAGDEHASPRATSSGSDRRAGNFCAGQARRKDRKRFLKPEWHERKTP